MCLQKTNHLLVGTGKSGRRELCWFPPLPNKLWSRRASRPSVSRPPANESARVDVPNSGPDLFLDLVPRGTFQSKRTLPSSRCAGYTKKPQGRRGRRNPTLRCWGCFRRRSFSPSPRSWGTSPSVMTTPRAPVSHQVSLCSIISDPFLFKTLILFHLFYSSSNFFVFFFSKHCDCCIFVFYRCLFFMLWWVESLAPCLREFIAFLVLMLVYMRWYYVLPRQV